MLNKLLHKLSNKHFLALAGNGTMAILSIVTYSLLYRLLTEVEMGNWIFFQFALILVDTIRTGFLQTTIIKFFSGVTNNRALEVTGSAWYIALCLTVIFVIIDILGLSLIKSVQNDSLLFLIKWGGLAFVLMLPINFSTWILQAKQHFDKILYIRILNQGSFIVFILFFYFYNGRALNIQVIFYSYILSSLLTAVICLLNGWASIRTFGRRSRSCTIELLHFGKYSVGTLISSSLLKSSDTFIINFMLGPTALAIYNLPQRLMEIIEIPIRSLVATAMPEMSVAANKKDNLSVVYIMKKYAGLLTMAIIPLAIVGMLTSNLIVGLIGGGKYINTEATNIFRILLFFAALNPIDRFMGITLDIIHKPHLNLIKVLLTLFVNAVTDVICIHIFHNIYGPAWASIFTFFVAITYGYIALKRSLVFTLPEIIRFGYSESINLIHSSFHKSTIINV
jgi:O-antigen/teichoic acid export membrane protein